MVSEAQRRATRRYEKANVKQKLVKFFPGDSDILAWLESRPEGMSAYIKRLIREDMERERKD